MSFNWNLEFFYWNLEFIYWNFKAVFVYQSADPKK